MLAEQLKTYLDKAGIHYAWVMAAIVFMFTLATSTTASAPQILILPYSCTLVLWKDLELMI